jgi:hypothetical protein
MKSEPFCCDIYSGSDVERREFISLFIIVTKSNNWDWSHQFYGISNVEFDYKSFVNPVSAIKHFTRIIPLSEGIQILKSMAEEKINMNEMHEYPIQITNNRMCTLLIPKDTTPAELTIVQAFIEALKPN